MCFRLIQIQYVNLLIIYGELLLEAGLSYSSFASCLLRQNPRPFSSSVLSVIFLRYLELGVRLPLHLTKWDFDGGIRADLRL